MWFVALYLSVRQTYIKIVHIGDQMTYLCDVRSVDHLNEIRDLQLISKKNMNQVMRLSDCSAFNANTMIIE